MYTAVKVENAPLIAADMNNLDHFIGSTILS